MTVTDEALSALTHRIGIANVAASFFLTAFVLTYIKVREPIVVTLGWIGLSLFCFATVLAYATIIASCLKAPDQEAKRRQGKLFLWPMAAHVCFAFQALLLQGYVDHLASKE